MYSGYTGQKLDEPVLSSAVDFYTKFGLHGLYEPKSEKNWLSRYTRRKNTSKNANRITQILPQNMNGNK